MITTNSLIRAFDAKSFNEGGYGESVVRMIDIIEILGDTSTRKDEARSVETASPPSPMMAQSYSDLANGARPSEISVVKPLSRDEANRICHLSIRKNEDGSYGYSHSGGLPFDDIFACLKQQGWQPEPVSGDVPIDAKLKLRDEFIVGKGLWHEFVDSLSVDGIFAAQTDQLDDCIEALKLAQSEAIKIAAELVRLDGMPSDDASDYKGRMPKKVLAEIERAHKSQLVRGNRIKISVADRIQSVIKHLQSRRPMRESVKVNYGFKDRLAGFDIDATLEALHTQYQIRGDAIVARNSTDAPTMKQLSDIRYAHLNIIPILKMLKAELTKPTSIEGQS